MGLVIYNSMTRQKEPFTPEPGVRPITIYNCGPTVYDRFHIGNARNFVVMDVVRRYLEWLGYQVRFVQNLTDIDDKIIARAAEAGVSADALARQFTDAYFEDADKLGVQRADSNPKATEYVPQMIDFMRKLEAAGFAYARGGSLYFRVRKAPAYGKLSGRNLDDLLEGARVEVNEEKEDPLDFVLWKAAKPGEPKWPSPWGEGRPGWHTECAVMTLAELGETIDIHSGGSDLKFPHHENELAQRECLSSHPFVRYWMHNGFLNIDSEKMSKSIGNIRKIDQVLARFSPEAVRYFLLSAHYRHPLDYSERALEEANSASRRIIGAIETANKILELNGAADGLPVSGDAKRLTEEFRARFRQAMDDDFNTSQAFGVLHEIAGAMDAARLNSSFDRALLAALTGLIVQLAGVLRITPAAAAKGWDRVVGVAKEIQAKAGELGFGSIAALFDEASSAPPRSEADLLGILIAARKEARAQKAFAIADAVRSKLAEIGIALEDHPQGTIWREMQPSAGNK